MGTTEKLSDSVCADFQGSAASGPGNKVQSREGERLAMLKIIGVILIVLGIVALIFQGISYTKKEKVLDLGPIEATAEKEKRIPLPPVLGVTALVGGIVLLLAGSRKSS
jgi:hypothetical protein